MLNPQTLLGRIRTIAWGCGCWSYYSWSIINFSKPNPLPYTDDKDATSYKDEELIETVDFVLGKMDKNGDGYINYDEYRHADFSKLEK